MFIFCSALLHFTFFFVSAFHLAVSLYLSSTLCLSISCVCVSVRFRVCAHYYHMTAHFVLAIFFSSRFLVLIEENMENVRMFSREHNWLVRCCCDARICLLCLSQINKYSYHFHRNFFWIDFESAHHSNANISPKVLLAFWECASFALPHTVCDLLKIENYYSIGLDPHGIRNTYHKCVLVETSKEYPFCCQHRSMNHEISFLAIRW